MPVWDKKKYIILFFVAAILVSVSATGVLAAEPVFKDLSVQHSSYPYINYLVSKGIISGYSDGTFRPAEGITRAETAALLIKAAGIEPASAGGPTFNDVNPGHWAYGVIEAAAAAGFVKGYPDGTFRPESLVTRSEIAVLILKLTNKPLPSVSLPEKVRDVGRDYWARPGIAAAIDAGLMEIVGGDSFAPESPALRSQVARGLAVMLTKSPEKSELSLVGTLVPLKGEVFLKETGGEFQLISRDAACGTGAVIKTGPLGEAELNFPDGSGLRLRPGTEITIKEARGRSAIMRDGTPGSYVDYLEIKLDKGKMFGVLAFGYVFGKEDKAVNIIARKIPGKGRQLASARPLPLMITLGEEDVPWWEADYQKRVRVKVDMPWGVAGVRGTFWMNEVTADSALTSVADGEVELTANGITVVVPAGYASAMSGTPPSAPSIMSQQHREAWNDVNNWVQERAEAIGDSLLSAPSQVNQEIVSSVNTSVSSSGGSSSSGGNSGSSGGGGDSSPPSVSSTTPYGGAMGVTVSSPIIVTFNENISAGGAYNSIIVKDANGNHVTVSKAISGNTLTITPDASLKDGWPLSGTIRVVFNMTLVTDSSVDVQITGGGGSVEAGNASGDELTASYSGLSAGTEYTITIPAGEVVSSVNGTSNNIISWIFKTGSN
ncbi:MAG: S-layer homology domain-containing protein [Bacillota bacterium]